jgi:putative N6-adenine-specific DNA methylase
MKQIDLIATSAFGLESIVANELKQLGYDKLNVENGLVKFQADFNAIARCNLWLRSADRLLINVGKFEAYSFEELFEKTKALPWYYWLTRDAEFPVVGKSIKSRLFSVSDCQAIVKKAIVEKMKEKYHQKWFAETGPRYKVQVGLLSDIATLTIDTSGQGLHKRGYRKGSSAAPLKETLAAAMVNISRWKPDRALIDPFCGSGTIPIEAALIGKNIAPGIYRNFAAEKWPILNKQTWNEAREEALDLIDRVQLLGITGYDIKKSAVELSEYHAGLAGIKNTISFKQQEVSKLNTKYEYGYLITNPPYGERLSEKPAIEDLYQQTKTSFARLNTWSLYILTSYLQLEKIIKRKADKKRKLYNGRIQCYYYQFYGPKPDTLKGVFAKKD